MPNILVYMVNQENGGNSTIERREKRYTVFGVDNDVMFLQSHIQPDGVEIHRMPTAGTMNSDAIKGIAPAGTGVTRCNPSDGMSRFNPVPSLTVKIYFSATGLWMRRILEVEN